MKNPLIKKEKLFSTSSFRIIYCFVYSNNLDFYTRCLESIVLIENTFIDFQYVVLYEDFDIISFFSQFLNW